MAILKNTVLVNSGSTPWTRNNVLDALEEAIADLGWNSGSQRNGVVTTCMPPGDTRPWAEAGKNLNWNRCGGIFVNNRDPEILQYMVADTGTAYYFQKYYRVGSSAINTFNDYITIGQHSLAPGDTVTYYVDGGPEGGDPTGGSLTNGQTLYVIPVDGTQIALADSVSNAENEIAIDLTVGTDFFLLDDRHTDHTNIYPDFRMGDTLQLWSSPDVLSDLNISHSSISSTNPMFLQDTGGQYNTERLINKDNFETVSNRNFPVTANGDGGTVNNNTPVSGGNRQSLGDTFSWYTREWEQTHTRIGDPLFPNSIAKEYHLVSSNDSNYSVEITLLPSVNAYNLNVLYPHWDYTVPASGTASSLDLRVYRYGTNGQIYGVEVLNLDSTGYTDDQVFTIPGDQIGGVTPDNDITFGVNTNESSTGAKDGIPSIKVTNIGAGVNAYQKSYANNGLVVRLENDANKKYGITYYGFKINEDYQLQIRGGVGDVDNLYKQSSTLSHKDLLLRGHWVDSATNHGRYCGYLGMDFYSGGDDFWSTPTAQDRINFATTITPTAYPLKVVTYKATAPQDDNFAIIQFVQTINGIDTPHATLFLHKGTQYGNGVWDLDNVFLGSWTSISATTLERISVTTISNYYQYESADTFDNNINRVARDALYGYLRGPASTGYLSYHIANNMQYSNTPTAAENQVVPYFRHDDYDEQTFTTTTADRPNINDHVGKIGVGSQANFYKPLKGIPLHPTLAPIPYYMPDDFVCIMFDITPGQTIVSPGDTIEISPTEIYETVVASYQTGQTSYDGITSNTCKGIIFAARTT